MASLTTAEAILVPEVPMATTATLVHTGPDSVPLIDQPREALPVEQATTTLPGEGFGREQLYEDVYAQMLTNYPDDKTQDHNAGENRIKHVEALKNYLKSHDLKDKHNLSEKITFEHLLSKDELKKHGSRWNPFLEKMPTKENYDNAIQYLKALKYDMSHHLMIKENGDVLTFKEFRELLKKHKNRKHSSGETKEGGSKRKSRKRKSRKKPKKKRKTKRMKKRKTKRKKSRKRKHKKGRKSIKK